MNSSYYNADLCEIKLPNAQWIGATNVTKAAAAANAWSLLFKPKSLFRCNISSVPYESKRSGH